MVDLLIGVLVLLLILGLAWYAGKAIGVPDNIINIVMLVIVIIGAIILLRTGGTIHLGVP